MLDLQKSPRITLYLLLWEGCMLGTQWWVILLQGGGGSHLQYRPSQCNGSPFQELGLSRISGLWAFWPTYAEMRGGKRNKTHKSPLGLRVGWGSGAPWLMQRLLHFVLHVSLPCPHNETLDAHSKAPNASCLPTLLLRIALMERDK